MRMTTSLPPKVYNGGLFHCYILDESISHFKGVGSIFFAFILF